MASVRSRPDSPAVGAALAAVGGYLDAYTYLAHGHVFANAQTGNVVLLAASLAQRHWQPAALRLPSLDIVATTAVAFVAALQVSTFRLLGDLPYSSTLTTGNLRLLVAELTQWRVPRDPAGRPRVGIALIVLPSFAIGAAAGAVLSEPDALGTRASWVACVVLLLVLGAIVVQTRRLERVSPQAPAPGSPSAAS